MLTDRQRKIREEGISKARLIARENLRRKTLNSKLNDLGKIILAIFCITLILLTWRAL